LKAINTTLIIVNGSFFVGVTWLIVAYLNDKIMHEKYKWEPKPEVEETDVFIDYYKIDDYTPL
jgi:hypothetical protein